MITFLFIAIVAVVFIYLIRKLIGDRKKNNPTLSDSENESAVEGKTHTVMWLWLIVSVAGSVLINVLYKSPEEKGIERDKVRAEEREKKRVDDIANAIYKEKHKSLPEKVSELYTQLNAVGNSKSARDHVQNEFSILSDEIVGSEFEKKFVKSKDSLDKAISKENDRESSDSRKLYGENFRNLLLDKGLNIKVFVSGKDNKKIKLTYVLFDEVWFRKFETEGYFDKLHDQGFTDIELTDGFKYGQGVRYKN